MCSIGYGKFWKSWGNLGRPIVGGTVSVCSQVPVIAGTPRGTFITSMHVD